MGIIDAVLGSQDTTASAGIWPFLLGTGNQNIGAFNRNYAPPSGYNPALAPYMTGNVGYASPTAMQGAPAQLPAPAGSPAAPAGAAPAQYPAQAPQYTQQQAPAGSSAAVPAPGEKGSTIGGGQGNLGNYYYDFQKNNSIPVAPEKGSVIPGAYPSLANEFANGPAGYYPWMDVAGKTSMQDVANWVLMQGAASPDNGAARQAAMGNQLASGATNATANQQLQTLLGQGNDLYAQMLAKQANMTLADPSRDTNVGQYGLTDFLGGYSENPALAGQIGAMSSDVNRSLLEQLLPEARSAAINTGQYGGSRSGIAEGIARRGAAEEVAQQSGAMRMADYERYLQQKMQAGQQLNQSDIAEINAATQRYGTEADYNLGLAGLQNQGLNDALQYQLGIGGLLNQGSQNNIGALTGAGQQFDESQRNAMDINNLLFGRGTFDQSLNQNYIDSDKARYDYGQTSPMNWIMQYISGLQGAPATPAPITSNKAGLLDYAIAAASAMNGGGGGGVQRQKTPYGNA